MKAKVQRPKSKVSASRRRAIVEAIKIQVGTLRRSFRGIDGKITDRGVADEIELLREAIRIVRATL